MGGINLDNYLNYRWPEKPPENWTPGKPPRRPRRRLGRNLLVFLLVVALLGGLTAGGWFAVRAGLRNWTAQWETDSEGDASPDFPPEDTPAPAIPRAEAGLGVTLELDSTLTAPLTAHEIYELVLPAVVSIVSRSEQGVGAGSGVVMREDGYILTNYHVIQGAGSVTVMVLEDGAQYPASLVGCDKELDVAVLKIEAQGLAAARFGSSDALQVGDLAYAIGNPMGYLYGTMTDGIISYLDRAQTIEGTEMTLIQTSAVLNSGSSGGALVNERGQVVGITVAKVSGDPTAAEPQVEGLGFAIPISAARPFIDHILDTGETWRPAIGIMCKADEADGIKGVRVKSVNKGGPAEAAGILKEDLILSANGVPVDTVYGFKRVLNDAGVGGTVECAVLRNEEVLNLTAVLADSADLTDSAGPEAEE